MNLKEIQKQLFDYLGLEPLPIKYEELEEDSRFYPHDLYISINNKYIDNELESLKCIIHEIRHYYQLVVAYQVEEEVQYKYWKQEFKMNNLKPEDSLCLHLEIDAYAFTKYILKEWLNIEYHHNDLDYDKTLDIFIKHYYKRI